MKYTHDLIDGWYHIYRHNENGMKFVCRVQSKDLADTLIKEFNEGA